MRHKGLGCRVQIALVASLLLAATGCRSAYVTATVHNGTGAAVSVVEVDYPSASFGTTALADGADFHYRFKILGNGPTKVLWTDAAHVDHAVVGPELIEGQEGSMEVVLGASRATWDLQVTKIH